jgi:hypothetical protein
LLTSTAKSGSFAGNPECKKIPDFLKMLRNFATPSATLSPPTHQTRFP